MAKKRRPPLHVKKSVQIRHGDGMWTHPRALGYGKTSAEFLDWITSTWVDYLQKVHLDITRRTEMRGISFRAVDCPGEPAFPPFHRIYWRMWWGGMNGDKPLYVMRAIIYKSEHFGPMAISAPIKATSWKRGVGYLPVISRLASILETAREAVPLFEEFKKIGEQTLMRDWILTRAKASVRSYLSNAYRRRLKRVPEKSMRVDGRWRVNVWQFYQEWARAMILVDKDAFSWQNIFSQALGLNACFQGTHLVQAYKKQYQPPPNPPDLREDFEA